MTDQPQLVDVVPLQQRHLVSDLSPFILASQGARAFLTSGQPAVDGRPYASAPAIGSELNHLLGLAAAYTRLQDQELAVTRYEWRDYYLRVAALSDRIALLCPGDTADAAATQEAHKLQCWDQAHRDMVRGEWQADAIHWTPLSDDPASGSREYVRQEYPLYLQATQGARRV